MFLVRFTFSHHELHSTHFKLFRQFHMPYKLQTVCTHSPVQPLCHCQSVSHKFATITRAECALSIINYHTSMGEAGETHKEYWLSLRVVFCQRLLFNLQRQEITSWIIIKSRDPTQFTVVTWNRKCFAVL